MIDWRPLPRPLQNWWLGHWNAQPLTDGAEVAVCREILGQPEPSWWAVAREYIARFNAEYPMEEE